MTEAVEISYSMSELNDLVQRNDTCVTLQRKPRVLYLNPVQFSNIKSGIHDSLDTLLFKYDFLFKAIVLGYRKIKLLTRYGAFCYRSSKVSLQIEADFYLFNLEVGSKLKGTVCKRSGHHLGVLVHKAFTVFIPLNENNYETGWDYAIGQDIEFEVVSLDLTSGPLPYIKGKLIKEEKDRYEGEGEGTLVVADAELSYGNGWAGSDSGGASSPGRESEDSDDSDRNDVSENSVKESTIEEQTYKRASSRKSTGSLGEELMKAMGRETASEDESGVYSTRSLEKSDPDTTGGTSSQEPLSPPPASKKRKSILKKKKVELLSESESSIKDAEACSSSIARAISSQESGSDLPLSPPIPKKRKSILKVQKDISYDAEVTCNVSPETSNASLSTKSQTSVEEATYLSSKKRKSVTKKSKESISSEDEQTKALEEQVEAKGAVEGFKSPPSSKGTKDASVIDEKSKSILRNIVGDLSPRKFEMESVKSILETLERSESEKSFVGDLVGSPKAVPKPKNRMSVVKSKEVISSSDDEESEPRTVVSKASNLERFESKGVPINDDKDGSGKSPAEKQVDLSKEEEIKEVVEKSDDSVTKKKRKSLSKSKKRTSLLYESLAEKIEEATGGSVEINSETPEVGHDAISTPVPKNVYDEGGKLKSSPKMAKKTSPKASKKKSPKKKGSSPPAQEDLVMQLLKKMEMAIDGDNIEESANITEETNTESGPISERKDIDESKNPEEKVKPDSSKKAAGKRKSLPSKKREPSLNVEDMIKRLTETTQSPVAKHEVSPKEDTNDPPKTTEPSEKPEIQKRLSLGDATKDSSRKKSRKSGSNITPIAAKTEALGTMESLRQDDKISHRPVSTMGENENNSISPSYTLDNVESSVKTPKKQRQSMGEKKSKNHMSKVCKDTPLAVEEETDIQIEKLLMMNKKLLGLDAMDASEDQRDKVSNEEKKSKKRKRESNGAKDSSKKRKTMEGVEAEIPNT